MKIQSKSLSVGVPVALIVTFLSAAVMSSCSSRPSRLQENPIGNALFEEGMRLFYKAVGFEGFSPECGYGLIDAEKTVTAASELQRERLTRAKRADEKRSFEKSAAFRVTKFPEAIRITRGKGAKLAVIDPGRNFEKEAPDLSSVVSACAPEAEIRICAISPGPNALHEYLAADQLALGFFTAICLSFAYSPKQSEPGATDLKSYLPSGQDTGEWRSDGPPQEFKGDDLYLYIDGGAEIYREYGFEQVVVQDYKNLGGKGFSLEIFRMSNPEAAYGMYTFKRSPKGKVMSIGAEGQMEDYYLNFWKGSFLVTLTGYDTDPKTMDGLTQAARLVDKKIQEVARRPSLVAVLPRDGLTETSVRFFRGYLGFMNIYSSLGKEELGVREGVKGDYGVGCSLFILRYQSEQESRARFSAAGEAIKKNSRLEEPQPAGAPPIRLKDDHGKFLSLRRLKNYILLCLEDPGSNRFSELFEAVNKSI